ncbi:hypothetical protein [Winslowiella iniecta]|uniref:hypothetical protein n=1 Tax=Winslowiella iniecta TaxID=1560201 RepID=UPI00138F8066|nr:hypothetical protein [Winslowiella iniecta]
MIDKTPVRHIMIAKTQAKIGRSIKKFAIESELLSSVSSKLAEKNASDALIGEGIK